MSTPDSTPRGSAAARVARNGALTASADILSKVCSLVYFALVARKLGSETLGHYVFALALVSLLWSFASFGLDRMAMRDIAKDPRVAARIVMPMAAFKASMALVGTLLSVLALGVAGYDQEVLTLVVILGVNLAFALAASTAQTVFSAMERMEFVFLSKVPWAVVQALAGIVVLLLGGGIVAATAASALVVGFLGSAWCYGLLTRHFVRPVARLDVGSWRAMLRRAVPFGLQEMLGQIIFRFDTLLLALLASGAVVGHYGAAYRMLESTLFIPWSIGFAVMPIYSYLDSSREAGLSQIYEGSLKLMLVLMLPIATVLFVCAGSIVDLVYGLPQYAETVTILRVLAPAVAIYGIGHLAGVLVLVRLPGRVTVRIAAGVALLNIVACAILIPTLEGVGAAIATLVCETLLALIGLMFATRVTGAPRPGWVAACPVAAAAVMAAVMVPLSDELWLALPAGGVAYVAVLLALEAPRLREDLAIFRTIAGRRPEPEPIGVG